MPLYKAEAPAVKTRSPLQPITTSTPLELVATDFVHLEKSSAGYEYILVIVDHFTCYAQAYAKRSKSAKTASENCIAILFYGSVSQPKFTTTKEENSRTNYLPDFNNFVILNIQGQLHTIPKETVKLNISTVPFCQCYAPWPKPTNPTGKTTLTK